MSEIDAPESDSEPTLALGECSENEAQELGEPSPEVCLVEQTEQVEQVEEVPSPPQVEAENPLPFILEAISTLDHSIQRRFDSLHSTFDREVRAESTREKVVDRLHAELQEYKSDLLLNTLRPVFIDLIQLHDDIGKIVTANESGATLDPAKLIELMKGFQQGIEDILYRQGVEPYQTTIDDGFDPRRQRAFATVENDDPTLARRVAARLRKGFQAGEKVIRPEIVSVYAVPKPAQ